MSRTSPTETFSWRPPARTIAYTVVLTFATGAPPGDRPIATPWTTRDIGSVGAPTSQPTGGREAVQIPLGVEGPGRATPWAAPTGPPGAGPPGRPPGRACGGYAASRARPARPAAARPPRPPAPSPRHRRSRRRRSR